MKLNSSKRKKKHTHRARNHRAYQPVVIKQTRIVQRTLGREEMNLRAGGTRRGAERRERGRQWKERRLQCRAPRWWEDGRRGETGLPVPSAAADFWKGRRGEDGLQGISREEGSVANVPQPLWDGGHCAIHQGRPRAELGRGPPSQLLVPPGRPHTALSADAAPPPPGEGAVKGGSNSLSYLTCPMVTSSHGDTVERNERSSREGSSGLQWGVLPSPPPRSGAGLAGVSLSGEPQCVRPPSPSLASLKQEVLFLPTDPHWTPPLPLSPSPLLSLPPFLPSCQEMRWEGSGGLIEGLGGRAFYRFGPWCCPPHPSSGPQGLTGFLPLGVDAPGLGVPGPQSALPVLPLPPAFPLPSSQASLRVACSGSPVPMLSDSSGPVCFLPGLFTTLPHPNWLPQSLPMVPPLLFGHHLFISGWLPLGTPLPCIWVQKWRRFGATLYGQPGCASRLELQDGPEKSRRGEAARRVIRLSDCLRVTEVSGEANSPKDTSAFFLETKERLYLLAAPTAERSDWVQAICLLAFPVSCAWVQKGQGGGGSQYLWWAGVVRAKARVLGVAPPWGRPRSRMQTGQQAERALKESVGLRWGLDLVTVLRAWPSPQGQRKKLSGLEGQGSRPRMEENELYSTATTGEGPPAVPGRCGARGAEVWASLLAASPLCLDSSCLWLSAARPAPLSASLHRFRAWPKVELPARPDCQPFTPMSSLLPALLVG